MTLTPFSRSQEGSDHFQGHRRAQIVGKWPVCTLSPERMDGFWLNFYIYIVVTWIRADQILVTLTSFSRSHKSLGCWKMACLHPISWRNGCILIKLAQLYCYDMKKNWLDLVTLTLFSRSQEGSNYWKMAFLHPISRTNGWILTKLVHLYCFDMEKNWLDFGGLDPISKVTQGLSLLACLHPISWRNGWILTKLAQLFVVTWKRID